MKTPSISADGNCTKCGSQEWRLARVLVQAGLTRVSTDSNGGGFGVGVGVGSGQGGLGVNYQGIDLSTTGTYTSQAAIDYAPPTPPELYAERDNMLAACQRMLSESAATIRAIDEFADASDENEPKFFSVANARHLSAPKETFQLFRSRLQEVEQFEQALELWERTRICVRCGETFVATGSSQPARVPIPIPEFEFPGKERHCPECGSYQWKRHDIYYSIEISRLEKNVADATEKWKTSVEQANAPGGDGLLQRIARRVLLKTPEFTQHYLSKAEAELTAAKRARDQKPSISAQRLRVCTDCKTTYQSSSENLTLL